MEFQAFSWCGRDIVVSSGDDDGTKKKSTYYVIDVYGRAADGRSVCAHVSFTPYFFVGVQGMDSSKREVLRKQLEARVGDGNLLSCQFVGRKSFYGFTAGAIEQFALLKFASLRALRMAAAWCQGQGLTLFESNVPCELRLMHIRNLPSVGWVRCTNMQPLRAESCTICNVEFDCPYTALQPVLEDRTDNAPLVVASFDMECVSETGGFPDALDVGCPIIQIATTFWRITDEEPYRRHLACLGTPSPLEGVDVDACAKESDLLLAWARALCKEQVDIITGYNIFGFDFKYAFDRAALRGALGACQQASEGPIRNFPYLLGGKRTDHLAELQVRRLESSAYGQNEFCSPSMPGVLQLDLLAVIKKDHKLTSYKLDAVAEHFLGDRKVDLPIKEMFELYRLRTPEALHKIAQYCIKDTELPIRLLRKLAILPNMMEMAKAVSVPLEYLVFRGQQIKVFSVILKKARERGLLCPTKALIAKTEKYEGATVLEAKVGAHFGRVACLDFASLYPSIIRAHNMCHSTIVLDDARYGHLPGIEYATWDLGDGQTVKFAAADKATGQPVPALLPDLLAELAQYRKEARALQKQAQQANNDFLAQLYNGKQLAYKVTMNSLYGFCGAANGLLPCVPIAAAVTRVGRDMIATTKRLVEERYAHLGATVVYGDSVAAYTPVMVRVMNAMQVLAIEQLADACWPEGCSWQPMEDGKESCELPPGGAVEAWTEAGWTPVERIIRHAYHGKELVRVVTRAGLVDVTHDHSLLLEDGTPITPRAVKPGCTHLLQAKLPQAAAGPTSTVTTLAEARIMGMFYGGNHGCRMSPCWALTARTREALQPYKALCEAQYPGHTWAIYPTLDSPAATYSLFPMDRLGSWARRYDDIVHEHKVPAAILFGTRQVMEAFYLGLKDASIGQPAAATLEQQPSLSLYCSFSAASQVAAMSLFMLAEGLGFVPGLLAPSSGGAAAATVEVVFGAAAAGPVATAALVTKTMPVPCRGYVYDLTTSNHHFHAGVGRLVVHNTDSVMCEFPGVESMEEVFKLGEEAATMISAEFKQPIELEFEKVMSPFLLYSKKRYASLRFLHPQDQGSVDAKGISLVRRDSCGLVRSVTKEVLDLILVHKDPAKAAGVIHDAASRLLAGTVPLEELVLSKALRGQYKPGILQPHDVVRAKIAARQPGSEPRAGDRVPYVYVELQQDTVKDSITCRAEDPDHARSTGMLVDVYHYLHLLKSALSDTIEVLSPALDTAFAEIGEKAYLAQRRRRDLHAANARSGQSEITKFFSASSPSCQDPFHD